MEIVVVDHSDSRLMPFIWQMMESEFTPSFVILFGGDRWSCIEDVALAVVDGDQIIGIATIAPTDEMGHDGPSIIGCRVHPSHRRQGIGSALVRALVDESLSRYGQAPHMVGVTREGLQRAFALVAHGVARQVHTAGGANSLP